MRYAVVATTNWLLLVDLQSRKVRPLEFSRPEYYGISWFQDSDELVLSHSGLNNAELIDVASYAQSEKGWLSHGSIASRPFLSAPHQILCAEDDRVICANTGRNVITAFGFGKANVFQEAGLTSARWDRLSLEKITGDHLNSVFLRNNHLYVIAHAHTMGSKLATFSYPEMELISIKTLGARTGLHNIWVTAEGQRISCHSENGSLIDLDDPIPLWESGSPVYTRGLAADGSYVLVGESQKTGRDLRRSSLSGLWILDRRTWQSIDYIALGPFGAVNEVRVLDVADDAHHGHPFKGLESILSKDVLQEVAKNRLVASHASAQGRRLWAGWEQVFGSPEMLPDGSRYSTIDQLCLIVRQVRNETDLAFNYRLEATAGAHVSAVLGYQGAGADRSMIALLLQPSNGNAVLSLWRHDGAQWSLLANNQTLDLPLSGAMEVVTTDQQATLSIDGEQMITLNFEALGLERCNHGLGIRWIGASVRPLAVAE